MFWILCSVMTSVRYTLEAGESHVFILMYNREESHLLRTSEELHRIVLKVKHIVPESDQRLRLTCE